MDSKRLMSKRIYYKTSLRGRHYERELAEQKVGKKQPMSGAGEDKNDLISEHLLIEAKSTAAETSYSLKKADLIKVRRNAAPLGKIGVMYLDFSGQEFVILSRKDFEEKFEVI